MNQMVSNIQAQTKKSPIKRDTHTDMGLVNAPQELVPSRYALRVGEAGRAGDQRRRAAVAHLDDGHQCRPSRPRAVWLDDNFLPQETFDWPLNVMVVRSGDQTILVDAGLGGQFSGFPRAGQFPQRLEAAGIHLESVTDVIITHMHMDHVGGLLVDDVKNRLRPDVRIHVAAAEVKFWTSPDFSHTAMPKPVPDVLRSTATSFYRIPRPVRIFDDKYEVAPGVVVRLTGGHTPGHSVVDLDPMENG
jgi:glyoxylase-like metal-dependent hydrolase (beta-lactamase superfamily II)